jgi:hypothetical protein
LPRKLRIHPRSVKTGGAAKNEIPVSYENNSC